MASLNLKIRNYRAIPYRKPLELEISKGITFFLGPNNVGKSSLIRMFFELRPAFLALAEALRRNEPNEATQAFFENQLGRAPNHSEVLENARFELPVSLPVLSDELLNQQSEERLLQIDASLGESWVSVEISPHPDQNQKLYTLKNDHSAGKPENVKAVFAALDALFAKSVLIPSLRPVSLQTHDPKIRDANVGRSLISMIGQWQTGHSLSQKRQFGKLEAELGELFSVNDFRIEVSSASGNLQIRFDNQIFWIDDLGDGIAHFIFALANALFQKPTYVLIDEPENGLHPRLQQTFIRALAAKSTHGLIAASHSIGLARSTADRIYTVAKEKSGVTVRTFGDNQRYTPNITDSLHELGYAQFVELGGDCILLVEGQTDIKAFREILRKFNAEQNFIIWHLGGSGFLDSGEVTHELMEVKRLNPRKVAVIFDSERTSENAPLAKKFQDFKDAAEKLDYLVFPTDLHSTENYISQSALDTVYPTQGYRALTPFENFKKVQPHWGKKSNWKLFREMSREEIEKSALGKFIVENLLS